MKSLPKGVLRQIVQSFPKQFSFFSPESLPVNNQTLADLSKRMDASDVVWKLVPSEEMKELEKLLKEAHNSHPPSAY